MAERLPWVLLVLFCAGAAVLSLVLTAWFDLDPCHLCIFQRLLFMLLALAGLLALPRNRLGLAAGLLSALLAVGGFATAAYQTWLQLQPAGSATCVGAQMGPIERLVEWLGTRAPDLFMATGFCEDPGLVIFGLSLANWALFAFGGVFVLALVGLRARSGHSRPGR